MGTFHKINFKSQVLREKKIFFRETQSKIARNHKHLWINSEFLWSP